MSLERRCSSQRLRLSEHRGDVILVNGICYEFSGYTTHPPDELGLGSSSSQEIISFNTCEECGGSSSGSSLSSGSSSSIFVPTVTCTQGDETCILPQEYIVTLSGLSGTVWAWANGTTSLFNQGDDCIWGGVIPDTEGDYFQLRYISGNSRWRILITDNFESLGWVDNGPSDPCDPTGIWGLHDYCLFSDDCEGLVTTCNVSAPPGF